MRLFIRNTLLFLLLVPLLFYMASLYLLLTGNYKKYSDGAIAYHLIDRSKKKWKIKKLIFGDSVGEQFFSAYHTNDSILSLCGNASVNMVGQYILLNNYINSGNKVEEINLIMNVFAFENNLSGPGIYNVFLKPFYTQEYEASFSPLAKQLIRQIPFSGIVRNPCVLTNNWSPKRLYKKLEEETKSNSFLSPISIEYLLKIKALSKAHHFKMRILPTPVNILYRDSVLKLDTSGILKNGLTEEFRNYFDNIIYLNKNDFTDGTHLQNPEYYAQLYLQKYLFIKK